MLENIKIVVHIVLFIIFTYSIGFWLLYTKCTQQEVKLEKDNNCLKVSCGS